MISVDTLRSWEFILLVLTNLGVWLSTAGDTVPTRYGWVFTAASAGVYALARGLAKINQDGKPIYQTTEFYVVIIGAVAAIWGGFQSHVSHLVFAEVGSFLVFAAAIANGLRTPPGPTGAKQDGRVYRKGIAGF